MALTLEQILAPITVAEAQQFMIDVLKSLGFSGAASWQSGSLARTVGIEVPARVMADLSTTISEYAKGGYNDTASADYLTIFSKSHYENTRVLAKKTQGMIELTSAAGAPPYTIAAGDLQVADEVQGETYRNMFGFTLGTGVANFAVQVEAEVAGRDGNVPINTITILQTTLAGVTVNNPGISGEWITQVGTDDEEDADLQTRNRTKWATRAYATPEAGYENYAREADAGITRVYVDAQNPEGPGSLTIYIAGPEGSTGLETAAQNVLDYLNGVTTGHEDDPRFDGYVRRPLGAIVDCVPADEETITVTAQVFIAAAYNGTAQAQVEEAIEDFFESIPIGGTRTTGTGYVFFSALYMSVMQISGVMNVVFSAPTADVALDPDEVPVPDIALTFVVI